MDEMKRIDRVLKYKGSIVDVYDDVMQSPTGKIAHWDYVAHRKGAAAVLPVLEDGRILMVRQYRNALDRETLEIPAGSRDSTEEATSVCAAVSWKKRPISSSKDGTSDNGIHDSCFL